MNIYFPFSKALKAKLSLKGKSIWSIGGGNFQGKYIGKRKVRIVNNKRTIIKHFVKNNGEEYPISVLGSSIKIKIPDNKILKFFK